MVGWAKSRGESFFREKWERAVWKKSIFWRSETMDAICFTFFKTRVDQATHLSFPHTWRNGTGAVSGSSSGISHYCAYPTASSPGGK